MKRFYKVHEGFDLSGMSDIDYTDTFADIDDKYQRKHMVESILRSHILTGYGDETMPDFIWDDDCLHVDLKFPANRSFLRDNMELYLFADGVALAEIVQEGVSYTIDPLYRVTVKLTADGRGVGGNADVDLTGCPERCGSVRVCINEPFKSFSFAGSPREVYGDFIVYNMWKDIDDMTGSPDRITGSFWWRATKDKPGRLLSLAGCPSEILGGMSVVNSPCARFPLKSDRHVCIGGDLDAGYLDTIPDEYEREGFDRLSNGFMNNGLYRQGLITGDDAEWAAPGFEVGGHIYSAVYRIWKSARCPEDAKYIYQLRL